MESHYDKKTHTQKNIVCQNQTSLHFEEWYAGGSEEGTAGLQFKFQPSLQLVTSEPTNLFLIWWVAAWGIFDSSAKRQ